MAATLKSKYGPFKVKGRAAEYHLAWRKDNLDSALLAIAKCRAKKSGIAFNIEKSDVVIPAVCPILGERLVYGTKYAASIDRIDNTKGYIKGNVHVISRRANELKRDGTFEELRKLGEWTKTLEICQPTSADCLKLAA